MAVHRLDLLQQVQVDAVRIVDVAIGVGAGDHPGTQLVELLDGVDRHVAGARDDAFLTVERVPLSRKHLLGEEHGAVSGCLGAHLRATPLGALTGDHR